MGKVFISYRRQDSAGYVRALYNELAQYFGQEQIFMDVDDIPLGTDFVNILNNNLKDCTMMLVVIGPQWLDIRDSQGNRRLENADDFVRLEVARAIKQGFIIIPVLVNGAAMPSEKDLPDDLQPLSRRQALELDNKYYKHGMAELTAALEAHLGKPQHTEQQPQPIGPLPAQAVPKQQHPTLKIVVGVAILLLLGIGLSFWFSGTPQTGSADTTSSAQNSPSGQNAGNNNNTSQPASAQAGFDCRKAGTDVEDAICNDDETRKTDLELNRVFGKVITQLPPAAQQLLDKRQKDWLKQRDSYIRQQCFSQSNQGLIARCIQNYYQQRITTLARLPTNLISRVQLLDPPTNIRATPNGDIVCQVQQRQIIEVYNDPVMEGDGDRWYSTRICGEQDWGVIHESQISAVR
ncbi:MAG: TIR domain-containing protein [Thiolinea sp.]